jgi:hypothetical protein
LAIRLFGYWGIIIIKTLLNSAAINAASVWLAGWGQRVLLNFVASQ